MSYYQWYPLFRGKIIVTLHDFMHEKYSSLVVRLLHNALKCLSLQSADVILCISEATKNDLKDIYPGIHDKKDVRVIKNAVNDHFYSQPDDVTEKNQLLWVAGRSGYKNFTFALEILGYLKSESKDYVLSVVGPKLTGEERELALEKGVTDRIKVHTNITMDEFRSLYSNACALLYLSKYEGFGLPILEAQKCRCPVVAIENPSSMEVGRDSVIYIEDGKPEMIMDILQKLENDEMRNKIVEHGYQNALRFDWDDSVKKLVDVYMEYINT